MSLLTSPKEKIYCYVDETGLDPVSKVFLVSVVVVGSARDNLIAQLEEIERGSDKGWRKWNKARPEQRLAYIRQVLSRAIVKDTLHYAVYPPTPDYFSKTVLTVARAVSVRMETENYRATVFIDGLARSLVREAGAALRRLHIKVFKVRGIRKEESDALIRLADALCGFVRAADEGSEEFRVLLAEGKARGYIREL